MVRFFPLALLVMGLLIGGKAEVWLFPFPFPHLRFSLLRLCVFASLRLLRPRAREVSGKQRRKRSVIFGKRKRKRKGRRRKKKEEFGGTDVKTAWEGDLFFQF